MRRLTFITVAAFLFSLSLSAQTVDEIIAKNIAAKGGLAKIKAVQTIRITGNVEFGGMQAGFVQLHKRADKMRSEISIQGLTMIRAYDGQTGWQIVPLTGKKDPEPMADDDLKDAQEEADIDGPLMDYKQKGHKVELIGKEKTEGADAYHIRVTLKNGNVRDMFFDAGSFLAIKAIAKVTRRGTEMVVESAMGDYKEVQGLMVPFSIAQHQQGGQGMEQKIIIEKVEINVPIDDAQFKMPPAPEKTGPPPAAGEQQSREPN
jgi:hypothetical protein